MCGDVSSGDDVCGDCDDIMVMKKVILMVIKMSYGVFALNIDKLSIRNSHSSSSSSSSSNSSSNNKLD